MALASRFTGLASRTTLNRIPVRKPATPTTSAPPAGQLGPQAVNAPSVLPPDANYEATVAGSQASHDITAGDLARQRQQAFLQYGYTQDAAGNLAFDPSNPYSQAAILKRNYDQAQTGNTNSYAARGQLYSGALQNVQNESGFQYGRGENTLKTGLLDFLARNTSAASQNDIGLGTALGQAAGQRLQNAPDNPLYQPDASSPAPGITPAQAAVKTAYKTVPWKDSAGNVGVLHIYPDGRRVFVRS
jgi:hypothetical protein